MMCRARAANRRNFIAAAILFVILGSVQTAWAGETEPDEQTVIYDGLTEWGQLDTARDYLVIDNIYPFQNPDTLLEVVDILIDQRQPFALSVMPVYQNGDYPAMQHFCEILRYAQANGGTILLNAPLNHKTKIDGETVKNAVYETVDIYAAAGVYPLGLEIPYNWIMDTELMQNLAFSHMLILSGMQDTYLDSDIKEYSNAAFLQQHQWIWIAEQIPYENDVAAMQSKIKEWEQRDKPLGNLRDKNPVMKTDKITMEYKEGSYLLDGNKTDITYHKENHTEPYDYGNQLTQKISKDLSGTNRQLVVIVSAVCIMFLVFLIIARKYNKKKFFIDKHEKKGK